MAEQVVDDDASITEPDPIPHRVIEAHAVDQHDGRRAGHPFSAAAFSAAISSMSM